MAMVVVGRGVGGGDVAGDAGRGAGGVDRGDVASGVGGAGGGWGVLMAVVDRVEVVEG